VSPCRNPFVSRGRTISGQNRVVALIPMHGLYHVLQEYQAAGGAPVPHDEYFDVALYHLDTAAPDLDLFLNWLSRTPTYRSGDEFRIARVISPQGIDDSRDPLIGVSSLVAVACSVLALRHERFDIPPHPDCPSFIHPKNHPGHDRIVSVY
jgi:hypothetical protein